MEEDKLKKKRRFIKIPQTKITVRSNLFFAAGLILLFFGIFLTVKKFIPGIQVFYAKDVFLLGAGLIFVFFAFALTGSGLFVYLGIFFSLTGILSLFIDTNIIKYKFSDLWPLEVIFSGIALLPAGLYKLKRVRTIFLFPSLTLVVLGVLFLLFSLNDISFSKFIGLWWPIILLIAGIALIVIFVVQRNHPKEFPYMVDDSLEEEDSL